MFWPEIDKNLKMFWPEIDKNLKMFWPEIDKNLKKKQPQPSSIGCGCSYYRVRLITSCRPFQGSLQELRERVPVCQR